MNKKIFFSFIIILSILSTVGSVSALDETTASNNIRDVITSGVYTASNLIVDVDKTGIPNDVKIEYDTKAINVVDFKVGENTENQDGSVDRIAYISYDLDFNVYTLYTVDTAVYHSESMKSVCYAKVATYDENWLGINEDPADYKYYIRYKDHSITVKPVLGIDKNLPIKLGFDTTDFKPKNVTITEDELFEITGMRYSIASVSVVPSETRLQFMDANGNTYYQSTLDPEDMPRNFVYDVDADDYKCQDAIPDSFTHLSSTLTEAGLTGKVEKTYKTTQYPTGQRAELWVQSGILSKDSSGRYLVGLRAKPQVQVQQEKLQYNQIRSARNDYISIEVDNGETGEYPYAWLETKYITRTIGAEVYNVNLHFKIRVVVKLIVKTNLVITTSNVTDSSIAEMPQYQQGDMFWDNALEQDTGTFYLNTMSPLEEAINSYSPFDFSNPLNKAINSILWIAISAALIFVLLKIGPSLLTIWQIREQRKLMSGYRRGYYRRG